MSRNIRNKVKVKSVGIKKVTKGEKEQ